MVSVKQVIAASALLSVANAVGSQQPSEKLPVKERLAKEQALHKQDLEKFHKVHGKKVGRRRRSVAQEIL